MSNDPSEPFHIVIAGGGTAGWMAAAALSKLTACRVTLVESETIGTVGVGEATIPQIRLFNRGLGIDEAEFLRETKGTFKLGIEFDGWTREGEVYMHAFGPIGHGQGLLPFHQYWLRARADGEAKPLSAYSLNERAARALKMHMPQPGQRNPEMPLAYHFDAGLYAAFLRRHAEGNGATHIEGRIEEVVRGEHGLAGLRLDGTREVAGDFFIDCTGFRSLLLGDAMGEELEDWSHWLPCDRAVAVPCEAKGDFTPYTRSIAREAGWQWRIPLQHRVGNGHVYCSDFMDEDRATDILMDNLDGARMAEPNHLRFTTGMRRRQWTGNCLALGLAGGFMEPLESTSIHLIQSSIARFLNMLPGRGETDALADEFNRQAEFEWSRIRDFLILHYAANAREGQPFWDHCRSMALPETLTAKIEQFRARGYIHREHEELFTETGWLQVLVGQGILPETYHPNADLLPANHLAAMLRNIESGIDRMVAAMPGHAEFLRRFCMPRTAPTRMPETVR